MNKVRNSQIDIAKALGIILMCVGHSYCPIVMSNFICMFHMAFFFIISGWFFSYQNLEDPIRFVRKRIKSLWLPFYVWGVIFVLLHNLFNDAGLLSPGLSYEYSLKEILWKIFTTQSRFIPTEDMQRPYWFLSALFFCSLYSFLLFYCSKFSKKKKRCAVIFFVLSYNIGFFLYYMEMDMGTTTMITSLLYFVGYWLHKIYGKLKPYSALLTISSFFLLCIFCYSGRIEISIGGNKFENPILFIMYSVCGCFLLLGLANYLEKNRFTKAVFSYIGKNSISILLMNYLLLAVIHKVRFTFVDNLIPYNNSVYTLHCEWYSEYYAWYWWIIYTILMVTIPLICSSLYDCCMQYAKKIWKMSNVCQF